MHNLSIVPMPRQVEMRNGIFQTGEGVWRISPWAGTDMAIRSKLDAIRVRYIVDEALPEWTVSAGKVSGFTAAPMKKEGYTLEVTGEGFELTGFDDSGLFWGLVTVEQLLGQYHGLPCCRLTDWPEVALRGHFDDISRKQVSTVEDFKRIIRYLSRYKVNAYALYIEDMLHFTAFPDVGEGRGKLLPGEVRAIMAEAEQHKVQIIPALQLLGHHENLLALDNYRHLAREVFHAPSTLDPRKPKVRDFLTEVIREACGLFPGKYFIMGFDETQGLSREEFVLHANWCARELRKYDKTPVFWADMLYNHFGCDTIEALETGLIPGNWNYDVIGAAIPHQEELEREGRPVWGFCGYNNWARFLPDFETSKDHLDTWADSFSGKNDSALLCCQWGDNGYENSRDLCWNLYAYFGEMTWSGPQRDRNSFEDRVQRSFYGVELKDLRATIIERPWWTAFDPTWYWKMHRKNTWSMFRHAAVHPEWLENLERDREELMKVIAIVDAEKSRAILEKEHLDHFRVSLERMLLVVERMLFAFRHRRSMDSSICREEAEWLAGEVRRVREEYAKVWLRHNRRENLEVSLKVFDEAASSYERLIRSGVRPLRAENFLPLDVSSWWNRMEADIAGVPVGLEVFHGIPFHFAGLEWTHRESCPLSPVMEVGFVTGMIREIHLVATAPKPQDEKPRPALVVTLQCQGKVVYQETLDLITHLCDWWAPLGEHMWAGGGYRHADRQRVHYLLKPDAMYGLMRIDGFCPDGAVEADGLRLELVGEGSVQVFAVTLEVVPPGN